MRDLLRVNEVAEILGLHKTRVYELIRARQIPSIRVGGAIRIPRAAWDEWLTQKSCEAIEAVRQAGAGA